MRSTTGVYSASARDRPATLRARSMRMIRVYSDFFAAAADYNDDGETNSADFFDMLTDFFAGC